MTLPPVAFKVRLAPDLRCPRCGRAFRPYDIEVDANAVTLTCTCGERPLEIVEDER